MPFGDVLLLTQSRNAVDVGGTTPTGYGLMKGYRWRICLLLFLATTLNYMDRQVLALLKPTLQDPVRGIGLTEVQFAVIVSIFSGAYAIGLLVTGRFVDRAGTRIGYATILTVWTIAAASQSLVAVDAVTGFLHSLAGRVALLAQYVTITASLSAFGKLSGAVVGLGIARFLLGLGEAGNFPAAIKAVAEWFPREERAFATGIFNAGTNVGATLAPFAVGFLLYRCGWRYAFLSTTVLAAAWLLLWFRLYRDPAENSRVSAAERAYILQEVPALKEKQVPWRALLPHRQTWAFLLGKVLTDPVWWFYLYWLPGLLHARFGLTLTAMGLPLLVVYNACTIGSVAGGWLPARLIARGWSINRARKSAMTLYALMVTPIMLIGLTNNLWCAIALISLATSAHQAWSANLFTLASDMFPRRAVASIVGIGACGGSLSMMFVGLLIAVVLTLTRGKYWPIFVTAGTAYLAAIGIIHLLAPGLERVAID